jgi:hypothetical protein
MKKILNLPANLRTLFSVLQLLTAIGGVIWLVVLLVSFAPWSSKPNVGFLLTFADISFKSPANSLHLQTPASGPADIQLLRLNGELNLNLNTTDPELSTTIRWTLLPRFVAAFIATWLLMGLLKKLCARIEQGQILSEANLRSVRNLGFFLILYTLADALLQIWTIFKLGGYLIRHATITGVNLTLDGSLHSLAHVSLDYLIIGLLVLLVAEAFRQGLALKEENDLTV